MLLRGDDGRGVAAVERHGLLDEDAFIVLQSGDGVGGVIFVGAGDEDSVDQKGGKEVFGVERCFGGVVWDFLGTVGEGGGGDVGEEGDAKEVREVGEGGDVADLGDFAAADDADAEDGLGGGHG